MNEELHGDITAVFGDKAPAASEQTARETQNTHKVFPLVSRFIISRWSDVRKAIHTLPVGSEVMLPTLKWNSITTSITRLQDAYEHTRRYHISKREGGILVRRSE